MGEDHLNGVCLLKPDLARDAHANWGSKMREATKDRGWRSRCLGLSGDKDQTHLKGIWVSAASAWQGLTLHTDIYISSRKMKAFHRQRSGLCPGAWIQTLSCTDWGFTPKKKRRPAWTERGKLALLQLGRVSQDNPRIWGGDAQLWQ